MLVAILIYIHIYMGGIKKVIFGNKKTFKITLKITVKKRGSGEFSQ